MAELWILLIQFAVPLFFLGVAFWVGNLIAKRHEKSLRERSEYVAHVRCSDLNQFENPQAQTAILVTAEITMGIDHFRGFLGQLKNIFGGEIKSYQKTLDRARREIIMQLLEKADAAGHNAVANLRLEFVDISGKANATKRASMVTIMGYGTAYSSEPRA